MARLPNSVTPPENQAGWLHSTRGRTIQLQPPDLLRDAGTLDSTIHHELMHMLIESYARPGTPQWFREGLVLYLTSAKRAGPAGSHATDLAVLENALRAPQSEQDLRRAYAEARGSRRVVGSAAWKKYTAGVGAERPSAGAYGSQWPAARNQCGKRRKLHRKRLGFGIHRRN